LRINEFTKSTNNEFLTNIRIYEFLPLLIYSLIRKFVTDSLFDDLWALPINPKRESGKKPTDLGLGPGPKPEGGFW